MENNEVIGLTLLIFIGLSKLKTMDCRKKAKKHRKMDLDLMK